MQESHPVLGRKTWAQENPGTVGLDDAKKWEMLRMGQTDVEEILVGDIVPRLLAWV